MAALSTHPVIVYFGVKQSNENIEISMIEVCELTKKYGSITAIDSVSLTVEPGQVLGFIGENGAGKTTTMDIICGCLGADSGRVEICGFDVTMFPLEAKSRLGYLSDSSPLYWSMTVKEMISFVGRLNGVDGSRLKNALERVCSELSLEAVFGRVIAHLSKGFRQRVALACALVHDPAVIVLDEPTEGLDPVQISQFRDLIAKLKSDRTIMLSSHILQEVEHICDKLAVIRKGKIVAYGSYEEVVSRGSPRFYSMFVKANYDHAVKVMSAFEGFHFIEPKDEKSAGIFRGFDQGRPINFFLDREEDFENIIRFVISNGLGIRDIRSQRPTLDALFEAVTDERAHL